MSVRTLSDYKCILGEGAFWHPTRQSFFWFDILGRKMFEFRDGKTAEWSFDHHVSAAGWISETELMIASEVELFRFDVTSGDSESVIALEAGNPKTRSNDGRADHQGGFWIGTMAFDAAKGAGAIYRFYKGELRVLFANVTIPNSICFTPDGQHAYFTDTAIGVIQKVALDGDGWPMGDPVDWRDMRPDGVNPDGSVVDAEGNLWNAQWGASRVAVYDPQGALIDTHDFSASQITCPCLGGPDLTTLFATSAAEGLPDQASAGHSFAKPVAAKGLPEPRIQL